MTQELDCCVQIETGLVAALHDGHFIRYREDSPSNFSLFLNPNKQLLSSRVLKLTMILQLKSTKGKGWSEINLKKSLKQGTVTRQDYFLWIVVLESRTSLIELLQTVYL